MSAWPKQLLLADAVHVRRLERKHAAAWLKLKYPDQPDEILEQAASIAKPDTVAGQAPISAKVLAFSHPAEGHFLAAAWLLGASLSQLAILTSTSRSNCYAIINRRIGKDARAALRRPYTLTYEAVELLQKKFRSHLRSSPELFRNMIAAEIATFLEGDLSVDR